MTRNPDGGIELTDLERRAVALCIIAWQLEDDARITWEDLPGLAESEWDDIYDLRADIARQMGESAEAFADEHSIDLVTLMEAIT